MNHFKNKRYDEKLVNDIFTIDKGAGHGCIIKMEEMIKMSKVLFMNSSPNKNENTYRIGEKLLKNIPHDILHMADYKVSQYGAVYDDDKIGEILKKIEDKDIIVIGTPVYWYTVSGILKTFIDKLYMLPEAKVLNGKKLYLFAQGSALDENTKNSIVFLANRVAALMGMDLKGVVIGTSDGTEILNNMSIVEEDNN